MEYLGKQDEESGHFVGVDEGGWKNSIMMSEEGESLYSLGLLGTPQTLSINKAENASFWVTALRHMSPSFQPAAHGHGRQRSQCIMSTILRNLITCRAVDTKDSAIEHQSNCIKKGLHTDASSDICKVEKLGGSVRSRTSEDPWRHSQYRTARNSFDEVKHRKNSEKSEFTDLKPVIAAYKPVSLPTCSLCGKTFKPEKLHSHLKSCRQMKLLRNKAATATIKRENASSQRESKSSDKVTDQTSLLCH